MPLDTNRLAKAMANAVLGANLPDSPATGTDRKLTQAAREAALKPLAEAIVNELKNNALVTGNCPPGTAGGPLTAGRIT